MRRQRVIENPILKKNRKKLKKLQMNNNTGDENEIKSFIIIVVVLMVLIGATYGVTELLNKKEKTEKEETTTTEVNYDKIAIGNMLNAPYDEYYVLIYNADDTSAVMYSNLLSTYKNKKDSKKIYFCDLSNKLNSSYYNVNEDNKSNPKASKISELDLGDLTLIKVKKGKINGYYEEYEKIKKVLS